MSNVLQSEKHVRHDFLPVFREWAYQVSDKVRNCVWRDISKLDFNAEKPMPAKTRGALFIAARRSVSSVYCDFLGRVIKEAS